MHYYHNNIKTFSFLRSWAGCMCIHIHNPKRYMQQLGKAICLQIQLQLNVWSHGFFELNTNAQQTVSLMYIRWQIVHILVYMTYEISQPCIKHSPHNDYNNEALLYTYPHTLKHTPIMQTTHTHN